MSVAQKTGYVLSIAGILVFLLSWFVGGFRLTPDNLQKNIPDDQLRTRFRQAGEAMIGKDYASAVPYVRDLKAVFKQINQQQLETYGIRDEMLATMAGHPDNYPRTVVLEDLSGHFDDSEPGQFKRKAFQDYANWLDGRKYNTREQLMQDLKTVASNIEQYAIIPRFGFDRYQIRDLKFNLTRDATTGSVMTHPGWWLFLSWGLVIIGGLVTFLSRQKEEHPGIRNNGIFRNTMKNRGWLGILTGSLLIIFYILLYFYPEYMTNWVVMADPLSRLLNGGPAGQFFLYGFMYTLAVLVMGVRMLVHYRHLPYQMIRTLSVMFFQLALAFLIPEILVRLNKPYFDFKNIWPLDYDFFFDSNIDSLIASGSLGIFMLGWGIALIILGVPVFTYFFGKRWYCSWVCGCGGLAETMGDPYRQLSDKSLKAWKIERWMVHGVLVFAVVMTAGVLYTYWTGSAEILGVSTYSVREIYGAWIGAGFAGVVGTGFYPLMGNRVWCRFGCPLAAYLGIVQRFKSRFRITTNGGQCISCGNCSTYCEMGIDVRWYAQRGQNIVRASCVGCGICSAVCPRGVLKLENKQEKGRFGEPVLTGNRSYHPENTTG